MGTIKSIIINNLMTYLLILINCTKPQYYLTKILLITIDQDIANTRHYLDETQNIYLDVDATVNSI